MDSLYGKLTEIKERSEGTFHGEDYLIIHYDEQYSTSNVNTTKYFVDDYVFTYTIRFISDMRIELTWNQNQSGVTLRRYIEPTHDPDEILHIPDTAFLNNLTQTNADENHDGKISYGEAREVTAITCYSENILDLSGIEAFTYLENLWLSDTKITSLDLSNNKFLEGLLISNESLGFLRSLEFHRPSILKSLFIRNQPIDELDVSKHPCLDYFELINTNIMELTLCSNQELKWINLYDMDFLQHVYIWDLNPEEVDIQTENCPNMVFVLCAD